MTEAPPHEGETPRQGDPLGEQLVGERRSTGQAAEEPAAQPIVPEFGSTLHATATGERPGVNDASGATDDAIARRAYELYQARGGSHGADMDDWLQAEQELRASVGPSEELDNPAHRPID